MGGLGGIPNWDCNYIGLSLNPWRWGTNMYSNYYNSPNSLGGLYGATSNGYPSEFGFRLGPGDTPEPIGVSSRPYFSWGHQEPLIGTYGPGTSLITNLGTYHDTSVGPTSTSSYETCMARGASYLSPGMNMLLEWPTLDLTDPSIAKEQGSNSACRRSLPFDRAALGHCRCCSVPKVARTFLRDGWLSQGPAKPTFQVLFLHSF